MCVFHLQIQDGNGGNRCVKERSQYKSEILLEYDKYRINAKSIMGIIAFNPSEGMNVTIAADGKDEGEAVKALEKFFICQ